MTDSMVLELFREKKLVYVCAPMVRYSKYVLHVIGDRPLIVQFAANNAHEFAAAAEIVAG
ncbi:hypothetical protein C0J52_05871 [Blattella germanica]|nr:hypothetical protein C0J52_05871 [Blattella germanica]